MLCSIFAAEKSGIRFAPWKQRPCPVKQSLSIRFCHLELLLSAIEINASRDVNYANAESVPDGHVEDLEVAAKSQPLEATLHRDNQYEWQQD